MNVQHLLAAASVAGQASGTHISVVCPACASLHFIDCKTGKLLSEGEPPNAYAAEQAKPYRTT
jgi:hypothetical protein